jgi:Low affinity iron permease
MRPLASGDAAPLPRSGGADRARGGRGRDPDGGRAGGGAGAARPGGRGRRLRQPGADGEADRGRARGGLRRTRPPGARQPPGARPGPERAVARPARDAARRGGRLAVVRRAAAGPSPGLSQEWQEPIATASTIATFLLVFPTQDTQNRHTAAIRLEPDELPRAASVPPPGGGPNGGCAVSPGADSSPRPPGGGSLRVTSWRDRQEAGGPGATRSSHSPGPCLRAVRTARRAGRPESPGAVGVPGRPGRGRGRRGRP